MAVTPHYSPSSIPSYSPHRVDFDCKVYMAPKCIFNKRKYQTSQAHQCKHHTHTHTLFALVLLLSEKQEEGKPCGNSVTSRHESCRQLNSSSSWSPSHFLWHRACQNR
ncbi:hypothetical protein M5D96_006244 [Drosophila gunungcola]|uniref:Uncharacterized protein n=1 Tax=Drosophila gunungcola TaxID=103775 RepID=A0A9P9YPM8_9MUSC|nr:hypothetical protein M5D96_006244 [Drosophila gunungcola]